MADPGFDLRRRWGLPTGVGDIESIDS